MSDLKKTEKSIWEVAPPSLKIEVRTPLHIPEADDSLEFHAARLLLLIRYASSSRVKQIEGRTKLAKLDFFVRYPSYLVEAARLKNIQTTIKSTTRPESNMIRYKYGPWDDKYYDILAYMIAKEFIDIESNPKNKSDIFILTEKGMVASEELDTPEFNEIILRCKLVGQLFGKVNGNTIKKFIYDNFVNVVNRPFYSQIEGNNE